MDKSTHSRRLGLRARARTAWALAAVLAASALAASNPGAADPAKADPASADPGAGGPSLGIYRAVLQLPAGELPFGFELQRDGSRTIGYLLNGKERVKLTEVAVAGPHLEIRMPGYENRLSADANGGELVGEVVLSKSGAKEQHIPFHAQLGQHYRFFETPAHGALNVAGRWAVKFTDDGGKPELAVGEFTQTHDSVVGTFLAETGDHRYLAGQVKGNELYLSTFDGAHAFLYKAQLTADGALAGDFWVGTAFHEHWTGKRDANAALPDAYSLTAMRAGSKRFDFAFPDLAGKIVTSQDPAFKGKVMIVALAGSWCPNCHDEAAFLEPLYREYRGKGLEIVSLQFEHFGDFARAADATLRFRQHYGIEYTTLIAGVSDKDEAAKKLPMLARFYAFPTTIFVDRKGEVRKIHTGFSGPATGDHYTRFVSEVKATLDQLLAESLEMPSFDVVSEIDTHELTNAVDQAMRELGQRFDFKNTDARFELEETTVTMFAPADFQLRQMLEILKLRIAKRGIDVACLEVKDPEINLARAKQLAILKHGIDADTGRKVSKLLKDSKLKVQAQIQGDKVRVIGKKRDDLQEAIAFLRKAQIGVPLQFNNFRD